MIPSPVAVGRALCRLPPRPRGVAELLAGVEDELEFRRVVRLVFPEAAEELLDARGARDPEWARVAAFTARVNAELFPVYELETYADVIRGIPFVRGGWDYEELHELDQRPGHLLLCALCQYPYLDDGARVALLDACCRLVPAEILERLGEGAPREELHRRLDGTPFAGAALFADWLWAETGTAFLDCTDEADCCDADWEPEVIAELAAEWRRAEEMRSRIAALVGWLEEDAPARFRTLVDATLGPPGFLEYLRRRRQYAFEIGPRGLQPVVLDDGDPFPLPPGPSEGGAGGPAAAAPGLP